MTTMTLRAAQQIANRINRETVFEQEDPPEYYGQRRRKKTVALTASATINIDGAPVETVKRLRKELNEKRDLMFGLIEIGMRIRQAMAAKQAEVGVTKLVTERAALLQRQQILDRLLKEVETAVLDESQFESQVKTIQQRLSNPNANATTQDITTLLLTREDRDEMRRELAGTKRRVLTIDNELAELNSKNHINISDQDIGYLTEAGIA